MRGKILLTSSALLPALLAISYTPAFAQTPGSLPEQTGVQAPPQTAPAADAVAPESKAVAKAASAPADGDIVVTARRVSETLQNVPISVTAIGQAQLEANRTFTPQSLSRAVPSVTVFKNVGQSNGFAIYIRGVGRDNGNFNVEGPVAVYVDDVYYPYQVGAVIDLGGIERAEVLRGPQGTLYGRNATVGAVKYVTTRPDLDEVKGRANFTVGSYKRAEVNGGVSIPIVPDELAIKVDAGYRGYGGYMYDVNDKTHRNGDNTFSGKSSLLYRPNENAEIYASADITHSRNEPIISTAFVTVNGVLQPKFGGELDGAHGGGDLLNNLDAGGGTIQGKVDVGDVTLKSVSAYRLLHWVYGVDNTGFSIPNAQQTVGTRDRTFTQEFIASGSLFSDRLSYVAGLFYLHSFARGFVDRVGTHSVTRQTSESSSAYIDGSFAITDQLSVSAGVRYTKDNKHTTQIIARPGINFSASGKANWKATTPRFGVDYKITPDILAYASYEKGFKGGSLNSLEPTSIPAANVFVPPEKAESKEIGLKTSWLNHAITLNADYFWIDYTNQTTAFLVGQVTNLAFNDATIRGVEIEGNVRPTHAWVINGSLATLHSRLTNLTSASPAFPFADKRLKHAPNLTYRIGSHYTIEDVLGGNLTFGADMTYSSLQYTSIIKSPLTVEAPLHLVNVDASYSFGDGKYEIVLAGTNVTDKKYSDVSGVPYVRYYSAPAEYTATFKLRF